MNDLKNMIVVKRDGTEVPFDSEKIRMAIEKAFVAMEDDRAKEEAVRMTSVVCDDISRVITRVDEGKGRLPDANINRISVEDIQNVIEFELMTHFPDVAKAYILYRQKRTEARIAKSEMMKNVEKLVQEMNHDNANTQNSAASKMYGIAESVSKEFFLSKMSKRHAENHRKGRIYIHDLGYYGLTWNCFFNPLGKMLKNGFDNGVGYIRPPKRIASAVALACIILQSSQNDMLGGQGFLNFDTDLAPYVAKEREWQRSNMKNGSEEDVEKATEKAVYQAMEAFVYNMNTMRSRSGEMCAA